MSAERAPRGTQRSARRSAVSARTRTGILATIVAFGLIATGVGGYAAYALAQPLPAISPTVQPREPIATPEAIVALPSYGAAAIGEQDAPGTLLAGAEVDTTVPIASIAKVVTALVVLDAHPIDDGGEGAIITLTAQDSQRVADYRAITGATAPAPTGLEISQRSIIELMLVVSANNYADTLAVWAFGSVDAYVDAANAWLTAAGLAEVTVDDATGFSTANAATPRALLDLARLALDHPVVAETSAMSLIEVGGVGRFENRNPVLGVDGITGMKTGTTNAAGSCLLFSATVDEAGEELHLVGVVLGGPTGAIVGEDVRTMLASVRDDYRRVTLAVRDELVVRYAAPWGDSLELRVAEAASRVAWGAATSESVIRAPRLHPGEIPSAQEMIVQFGEEQVRVGLLWSGEISAPTLAWSLQEPLRRWGILPSDPVP